MAINMRKLQFWGKMHNRPIGAVFSEVLDLHSIRCPLSWCDRVYRSVRDTILELLAAVLFQESLRTACATAIGVALFGPRLFSPAIVWAMIILAGLCGAFGSFFFGDSSETHQDFGRYRPRFFLCWTTHMRFAPIKYSFQYPLLYVGFPAKARGNVSGGRMFSVLPHTTGYQLPFTFFTVDPKRYYNDSLPFDQKLNDFLISHNLDPTEYPHIYVVTTPGFFKIAFNPVSYYYLYNASHELAATVLEVNNTFNQSYMYILNRSDIVPLRKGYTYSSRIDKLLHISPFNKPVGYYDMQVLDPLAEPTAVDINMSVYSPEGKKTMVARATSKGRTSWDMQTGSRLSGAWITGVWGINCILALPLTLMEAARISWKGAKMHDDVEGRVSKYKGGKLR